MKKSFTLFVILFAVMPRGSAQDVIVFKNADEVQARVLEILPEAIKYVAWEFQDGPTRTVDKREVFFIKYQNGKKEVFNDFSSTRQSDKEAPRERGKYIHIIRTQGHWYVGLPFNRVNMGPAVDAVVGGRFYDYFFLGFELGYTCLFERIYDNLAADWMFMQSLSMGANMKGYIPVSKELYPFLNLSLGVNLYPVNGKICFLEDGIRKEYIGKRPAWFDMEIGTGIDYKRFSFGMGYNMLYKAGEYVHLGYLKLGMHL